MAYVKSVSLKDDFEVRVAQIGDSIVARTFKNGKPLGVDVSATTEVIADSSGTSTPITEDTLVEVSKDNIARWTKEGFPWQQK